MAGGIKGFFFGTKPKVPDFKAVDPGAEQQAAIDSNQAALPSAQKLAAGVNQISLQEIAKALDFALPGGTQVARQNILNDLSGVSDVADTKAAIRNATAAGWGSGTAGSQFGNLNVVGQLGRSVSQQRQQGFQNFMAMASPGLSRQFDMSSMFLTPQQRIEVAMSNTENQFNRDWLKAQISAAPDPMGAWTMELVMSAVQAAASAAGSGAAGCWVAREVYGNNNPMWLLFRSWLYQDAPAWFRSAYLRFGELVASMIRPFPSVKAIIRKWMTAKIVKKYGH